MDVRHNWFELPMRQESSALHALLSRAHAYAAEVYAQTGVRPTDFVVTEQEWRTLLTADEELSVVPRRPSTMTLMGMSVVRQRRLEWVPSALIMIHGPFTVGYVDQCITYRPDAPTDVCPCPCGAVVWDMPSSGMAEPLPPLSDLDEGLTCCEQSFATFADYMAHHRGVH